MYACATAEVTLLFPLLTLSPSFLQTFHHRQPSLIAPSFETQFSVFRYDLPSCGKRAASHANRSNTGLLVFLVESNIHRYFIFYELRRVFSYFPTLLVSRLFIDVSDGGVREDDHLVTISGI